ncbi:phosphatidylserine decarboxylase [bacterium]|nr:phosphatidylserine decarboxylase [bacterium]RQV97201.1 MAG: hypothetical protein EH221_03980 [bacterium]
MGICFLQSLLISAVIILPLAIKCKIKFYLALIGIIMTAPVSTLLLIILDQSGISINPWMRWIIPGLLTCLILLVIVLFRFYRDPDRIIPDKEHVILSPADGTILYVKKIKNHTIPLTIKADRRIALKEFTGWELSKSDAVLVGIEMSILDVHVNRTPVSGSILKQHSVKGKYISLRRNEAPFVNQRLSTLIDHGPFQIGIVQIASRRVRQIISYMKPGDYLEKGQRFGVIRFGSQVDVVIPDLKGLQILIHPKETVRAGQTIIAEYDPFPRESLKNKP